ncbi:helix-hairpin-helix domain-containing protein [Stenotrophomonas indicatrix]|uniref:ComEA family DNA-binding protein n=1 Tax=Stenotrophomonas indicatrix TaxID=2045451 RepID=UPI00215ACEFE|nr:helix-hairpin-helix domain-containing protein [Stenotrophomonas indicatrix]
MNPIRCVHVVTDTVPTDGIAGRDGQNHKEMHVVPGFVVFRALVLGVWIAAAQAAEPIDINRADAQALQQGLTMVGAAKAAAIVEHRRRHGPFHRVEDLAQVKGIGTSIVERNRRRITVGNTMLPADPVPGSVPVRTVPRR